MRDHVRHVGATEGVHQEHDGNHHQRWPERPPGRLEQHQHADHGDNQVVRRRGAGAARQLGIEEVDIGRAECTQGGKDPVLDRDVVARRAFERGKRREGEEYRERQVDRSGLGVVEHPESEQEGQG